jgi:hypothetical protein
MTHLKIATKKLCLPKIAKVEVGTIGWGSIGRRKVRGNYETET